MVYEEKVNEICKIVKSKLTSECLVVAENNVYRFEFNLAIYAGKYKYIKSLNQELDKWSRFEKSLEDIANGTLREFSGCIIRNYFVNPERYFY